MVGLGRTGQAAVRFLAQAGARVRAVDHAGGAALTEVAEALAHVAEVRLGTDGAELLGDVDLVVPSPGVPPSNPTLQAAVRRGVPVWSEIELAARHLGCALIAVTGTNGKSTVTVLIGEMLRRAGLRTFVGGNLGTPLIAAVGGEYACAVAEVSSFQLEWVDTFRPHIAVYLNLSPDHLDRYAHLADYAAAKAALFRAQEETDIALLNRRDSEVWSLSSHLRARVVPFGSAHGSPGAYTEGGELVFRWEATEERYSLHRVRLSGSHNLSNLCAAVAAARLYGVPGSAVQDAIEAFSGLPHRLEPVIERRGVLYVNDSKATNVAAAACAIESARRNVVWLAGGLDKRTDFHSLRAVVNGRVKVAILYGAARDRLAAAIAGAVSVREVETLGEAVGVAARLATPGDTVLLAPACASFDQFTDYADRGRAFRRLVEAL